MYSLEGAAAAGAEIDSLGVEAGADRYSLGVVLASAPALAPALVFVLLLLGALILAALATAPALVSL